MDFYTFKDMEAVSVPIRGLFNLTAERLEAMMAELLASFRPHQGII